MQSSASVKSNKITTGNKITAYSLGKALTCKVMPICGCSINKEALKVPLSLSAISFCFYFGPPAPCHRFISSFFPARPGRKGCGLNMSSHQRATSNLPPFASMVPINTLLPPRWEATDSEGDRRGPGVMEIWSAWKRRRKKREKKDRNRSRE